MGCFSGCLMSSAGIQKLFCAIYSAFKCSFDEFVGGKVVSLSYSSAIFAPPLVHGLLIALASLVFSVHVFLSPWVKLVLSVLLDAIVNCFLDLLFRLLIASV